MSMDILNPDADTQVWMLESQYGSLTFYFSENHARDNKRPVDTLWTCVITGVQKID